MNRFNNVLQKRINIENEKKIVQDALKDKYGIEDRSKIVVVEKASISKLFLRLMVKCLRAVSILLIVISTAIGILSLLLPETRSILLSIVLETMPLLK